ncbi:MULTISPECIES: MarR family winged helix-turn-helix transcriptional regulator [Micrococcales]|uniref:Homoprotocatechuate degradation operon regulator, HpaR n=2 Tax=Micrococcales TaxID=85006 RepID=A0A449D9K5_9MICO|nr:MULTISPECIES: MarR family transcriptional regulator [Micrococcales]MBP2407802.1 DNA-binding MarR family transcriptional regulator [Brachybacterium fresconis]VEW14239.1 homoprotocatechuate degradation operon regulator, HpaR [Brevibacterium casei]
MSDELVGQVRAALQRQLVHAILDNERVAREHGLRVTDLQTLHLMVLREDVRTPRLISDTTGMPTSTVTKLIDRLEQAGYVRRAPDPADRRKTRIELVPDAIAPLQTLYGNADAEFDALSRQFSSSELKVVIRYLEAVSGFYGPDDPMG